MSTVPADEPGLGPSAHAAGLADQLAFERALADISARFAAVVPSVEAVEAEVVRGLRELIDFLDVDRASLLEVGEEGCVVVRCAAAREGVAPLPLGLELSSALPWYAGEVLAGRKILLPRLPEGLPPDAELERRYSVETGMRGNLTLPIVIGRTVRFAIASGAFRAPRPWSEEMIARLKLLGEVFAQALVRARTEERLRAALAEVSALKEKLEAENVYLREAARVPAGLDALSSRAVGFRRAVEEAEQVAATRTTVLLLGETGTGKELMASFIHATSPRRERPMIKLNCAALPASLIEAELFGREKGAYTGALTRQIGRFELADGSTLFLDEVGELPPELQPKLLRVLQEGELERIGGAHTIRTDVRVIAATNRPLADDVRAGRFREDLYYRLNVFPIRLPPLRERAEDIPMLVWQFVRELGQSMGRPVERIDDDTMRSLQAYPWPGNIRELRNVVERAMILCRDGVLRASLPDLPADASQSRYAGGSDETLAVVERRNIEAALQKCGWRVRGANGAAKRLGLKPTTLESRMKKLGIERPR